MAKTDPKMELKSFRFAGQRDPNGPREYKPGGQVTEGGGEFRSRRIASVNQKGQSIFVIEYENGMVQHFINCPIIATYGPVVVEEAMKDAEEPEPETATGDGTKHAVSDGADLSPQGTVATSEK